MLIELSTEQIEYLVGMFDEVQDSLDDFEAELSEVLQMALIDADDFNRDHSLF